VITQRLYGGREARVDEVRRWGRVEMTDDDLQPLVATQYLALADVLEGLEPAGWETPSLCEGWRVREVVAHLTMPARYDEDEFLGELRDAEFDFTRLSNQIASRDASLPTEDLTANLRDDVMGHWTPPGGGFHGALNHVVIHGLDITVPLGEPRCASDAALVIVLDDLTRGGVHDNFGTDISGRALEATDIEWSFGTGTPLRGMAEDLALDLCGRRLPEGRLDGTPLTAKNI
jgi:uncharacterized protein (TIGR03083 family)